MIVRLIPYSDVFVNVTLTLDEATELLDALAVVRDKAIGATAVSAALEPQLEDALTRAAALKKDRGY